MSRTSVDLLYFVLAEVALTSGKGFANRVDGKGLGDGNEPN